MTMATRSLTKPKFRNRLLKNLPPATQRRLRKHLEVVTLSQRDSLHEPGKPFRYVYFPETAMATLLTVLKDGAHTEVASVGCEGIVGLSAFLGARTSPRRALCQMPGTAWRLSTKELLRHTRRGGPLSDALHRYALALFTLIAQVATCNRQHTIEQRCCCWLLMTHDRVDGDEFFVTHEFLAEMLGARRAGVTVIAGNLQRAGLITYTRGRITILNRQGLEKAACECYEAVRGTFDKLIGR